MPKRRTLERASTSELRVRIRNALGYKWVWQLVMPDGHVVDTSREFDSRDECEADAVRQGESVDGLRQTEAKPAPPSPSQPSLHVFQDDAELWQWEMRTADGAADARSAWAFLTLAECEADYREVMARRPAQASGAEELS